jgi:ribonuclease HII
VSIDETDGAQERSIDLKNKTVDQIRVLSENWSEEAPEWTLLERDERAGVRRLVVQARKRWDRRRAEQARRVELLQFENRLWGRGVEWIAGVDEAGRGCLAGPVVAAAVILPPDAELPGLDDSKKLSASKREALYDAIKGQAVAYAIARVDAEDIDRINILQASLRAMREALNDLTRAPQHVLVDGHVRPGSAYEETALVDGDARSLSIAAASVLAKVHRDRLMVAADQDHPEYGFAGHKGYGSPDHMLALRTHGPCPLHRRSFAPVAELVRPVRSEIYASFSEGIAMAESTGELERMGLFIKEATAELADDELKDLRVAYRRRLAALKDTGHRGELRAEAFLIEEGYEVLERRYRGSGGEIDLIARKEEEYVFVEVKTCERGADAAPEQRVDGPKKKRLVQAAQHYIHTKDPQGTYRFDVIAIALDDPGRPHHWKDAFRP